MIILDLLEQLTCNCIALQKSRAWFPRVNLIITWVNSSLWHSTISNPTHQNFCCSSSILKPMCLACISNLIVTLFEGQIQEFNSQTPKHIWSLQHSGSPIISLLGSFVILWTSKEKIAVYIIVVRKTNKQKNA